MTFLNRIKPVHAAWLITCCFFLVYASISLYNHSIFRTFALDLGIKNQALYDYAHFRYNYNTVMHELDGQVNILANHFEPVLFLFGPLYFLFGSYTLLIVQLLFILAGGWGIYCWIKTQTHHPLIPLLGMATFYSMWGIFSALSYDFHTNVLGAMLLPWVFYFVTRGKFLYAALIGLLMMNCKENMALWSVFIGLGMAWHFRKERKKLGFSLVYSVFALGYFVLVMSVLMPYFADGKMEYLHFQYSALGANPAEVVHTIFTKPLEVFKILFENHLPEKNIFNERSKAELHEAVFLSGGIFLFLRPQFLLMLIPVYGQKLFSDDPIKWGVFVHYSIEFAPVLVLAAFSTFLKWRNEKIMILAAIVFLLSCLDTTKAIIESWKPIPYSKQILKFYAPSHYTREIGVKELKQALKTYLPEDVPVAASSIVVPHIANRENIYYFPRTEKVDYIVFVNDGICNYPMDSITKVMVEDTLRNSSYWDKLYDANKTLILKRK